MSTGSPGVPAADDGADATLVVPESDSPPDASVAIAAEKESMAEVEKEVAIAAEVEVATADEDQASGKGMARLMVIFHSSQFSNSSSIGQNKSKSDLINDSDASEHA